MATMVAICEASSEELQRKASGIALLGITNGRQSDSFGVGELLSQRTVPRHTAEKPTDGGGYVQTLGLEHSLGLLQELRFEARTKFDGRHGTLQKWLAGIVRIAMEGLAPQRSANLLRYVSESLQKVTDHKRY